MSDFGTVTEPDTVRIERVLPGPVERIWAYLTEPDKRGCWLAAGPMELRVGGDVSLVFRNSQLGENDESAPPKYADVEHEARLSGHIIECEPNHRLAYTWGTGDDASEVLFELSPRGVDVLLAVTHRRLASRDDMISVASGWHTHLGILGDLLHGRTPTGFWKVHTPLEAAYRQRIGAT